MASNFKSCKFRPLYLAGVLLIFTVYSFTPFDRTYATCKIGGHTWMAENLDITCFRNGDSIPLAKSQEEWINYCNLNKPARCNYLFDPDRKWMGCMYNYYAIHDTRNLAPEGWRLPMNSDWWDIEDVLGPWCAKDLKSDDSQWIYPGTNSVGFNALPTGGVNRGKDTNVVIRFSGLDTIAFFWSADTITRDLRCTAKDGGVNIPRESIIGWSYMLAADKLICLPVSRERGKYIGQYVRCVKSEDPKKPEHPKKPEDPK